MVMKIKLVTFEDGLVSIGFRRVSSYVKLFYQDVETFFYNVEGNMAFIKNIFFSNRNNRRTLNPDFIKRVAYSDVVGISCMSKYGNLASEFIEKIRLINPSCYIVWGGVHAIMNPMHCIQYADAVCIGEGEKCLVELLDNFNSKNKENIEGFWFRNGEIILKNSFRPVLSAQELSSMPFQDHSNDVIYVDGFNMARLDSKIYLKVQGSKYTTMWSIGCPFRCSYCGNSRFLANDKNYAKLRYPGPEFIIKEIKKILEENEYISFVEFQDDNFFLIKEKDIIKFAELYKQYINVPFYIPGFYPGTVKNESILDLLIDAGLVKVRMGIQSGSEKILEFFKRKTSRESIINSANILISRYPRISPPFFDIIMDVPFEDENDIQETLSLLRALKRPFFLYIYSLRLIPGTEMEIYAKQHPDVKFIPIDKSYGYIHNKRYGLLLYTLALGNLPKTVVILINKIADIRGVNSLVLAVVKLLYYGKRSFYEIKMANLMPFSVLFPNVLYFAYRVKLLKYFVKTQKATKLKID